MYTSRGYIPVEELIKRMNEGLEQWKNNIKPENNMLTKLLHRLYMELLSSDVYCYVLYYPDVTMTR